MAEQIIKLFEYFANNPLVKGLFIGYVIFALVVIALVVGISIFVIKQIKGMWRSHALLSFAKLEGTDFCLKKARKESKKMKGKELLKKSKRIIAQKAYEKAVLNLFVDHHLCVECIEIKCRCKDCKHWTKDYGGYCRMHGLDGYGNSLFGENSFCSLGERKDKK